MPLVPVGNTGSMLDRAVVAYLISVGCGSTESVVPSHNSGVKGYPILIVNASDSQEMPKFSGIEMFDLKLIGRAKASNQPNESNPEQNRVTLDALIGLVMAAMTADAQDNVSVEQAITDAGRALATSSDHQIAANNADMAQFTVTKLEFSGSSRKEIPTGGFEDVKHFICHACPKALS